MVLLPHNAVPAWYMPQPDIRRSTTLQYCIKTAEWIESVFGTDLPVACHNSITVLL